MYTEYTERTAKLLRKEDASPEGATPGTTDRYVYECPCGKGEIEYVRVPGYDDAYVNILCPVCQPKYDTDMGNGYWWAVIPRRIPVNRR